MKRILLVLLVGVLLFTGSAVTAQEEQEAGEETIQEDVEEGTVTTEIPWGQMDDRQIALMIINRQIDYLMEQIEMKDKHAAQLEQAYEERLEQETQRRKETVEELRQEIEDKDEAIAQLQGENRDLERRMLMYTGENAVYLKMVISLLVGVLLGLILASILRWWKYRNTGKTNLAG